MSLYTKALRHIDMNRVKELREEKIKKQKIAEEKLQGEIIRAKLKKIYAEQIKHYDWRRDLGEGMTTADMGMVNLNATGDIDLATTSMDASSFDLSTDASFGSGTGSGFIGGFSSSGGIMNLSGDVESVSAVLTNAVDLSQVDTVNVSAIAGNNSNGGIAPDDDLFITFILGSEFSDEITIISKSSGSSSNVNITVPENFRKSGVQIYLSTTTGTHGDQGRALKPHTIQINGLNHGTMGSLDVSNIVSFYLRDKAPSNTNYIDLGKYLWDNVQRALHGSEVSENPEYPGTPGAPQFLFNDSYTPAPVSGRTALAPTGGDNTVTNDDYRFIGEYVYDTFKGSKLYGVSNISFRRKTPMNVFVSLDDPEATAFIRDILGNQNLSPAQKKKKLEQMLGASAEYLNKVFGKGIFTGATEIADYEPQQSFMDIMVGDQRITQQDGKTINDTTRGIEDGKMDGKPIFYDNQGNIFYDNQGNNQQQNNQQDGIPYYGTAGNDQTDRQSTSTQQTSAQQKQIQNAISNNSEIANAAEKLGTQGKTFLDYLTGNLPDTIDNDYLGQEYVNSIFKNAKINNQGTISVGDNIVGTGGEATYDPKTDQVTIPFNYDFKTNDQEFSDPSKAGRTNAFQRAVLNAMGPYSADAQPSLPPAAAPIQSLAGIVFGAAIGTSKALGGASHRPGEVTMNADQLKKTNPTLYRQLVKEETIMEKKKLKSPASLLDKIPGYYDGKPAPLGFPIEEPPKMVNGRHPDLVDGKKVSNRYNRLDPISAKSMPKTGNPHIDKKVRSAANKPK